MDKAAAADGSALCPASARSCAGSLLDGLAVKAVQELRDPKNAAYKISVRTGQQTLLLKASGQGHLELSNTPSSSNPKGTEGSGSARKERKRKGGQ